MSEPTVEQLKDEVERLTVQVRKNTAALVDTGRQVLTLQIDNQRRLNNSGRSDSTSRRRGESGDDNDNEVITTEDIVQLTTELQGQLDILDARSVRRTANAFVSDDSDPIAPLPGRDGDYPTPNENFPTNLREFKDLDDTQLEYWLKWYELVPPDEEELAQLLDKVGVSVDELDKDAQQSINAKTTWTEEEKNGHFDNLARFLGLRARRTQGAW